MEVNVRYAATGRWVGSTKVPNSGCGKDHVHEKVSDHTVEL